jgi:hypothetical protein
MTSRFSYIVELNEHLKSKVVKRHLKLYGDELVFAIIRSSNYDDFNKNRTHIDVLGKKVINFRLAKRNTYNKIKQAQFKWSLAKLK